MATWAIGDIHGEKRLLDRLLEKLNLDLTKDALIFMGDYIDRGEDSFGVLKAVTQLKESHPQNVITLIGNHEAFFLDFAASSFTPSMVERKEFDKACKKTGAYKTIAEFLKMPQEEQDHVLHLMSDLELYYEGKSILAAHGPLPERFYKPDAFDSPEMSQFINLCLNGADELESDYRNPEGKLVLSGHRRRKQVTMLGDPQDGGMLMLDTGSGMSGSLSACNLDSLLSGNIEVVSANRFRVFNAKIDFFSNGKNRNSESQVSQMALNF